MFLKIGDQLVNVAGVERITCNWVNVAFELGDRTVTWLPDYQGDYGTQRWRGRWRRRRWRRWRG